MIDPCETDNDLATAARALAVHTVSAGAAVSWCCEEPQAHTSATVSVVPRHFHPADIALPLYTISLVTQRFTLGSLRPIAERQAGGREPAPGALRLVQSFVNSRWDLEREHQEQWTTPAALSEWLAGRGLLEPGVQLDRNDLARALDVRDGLRALLFANNGLAVDAGAVERLNRALRGPGLFVQLAADRPPDFAGGRRDLDAALAVIATIAALAQLDGRWGRLKACPGEHCGWAFYDYSRNQGSNWCAMSVCGSRAKARAYRRRTARSERTTRSGRSGRS